MATIPVPQVPKLTSLRFIQEEMLRVGGTDKVPSQPGEYGTCQLKTSRLRGRFSRRAKRRTSTIKLCFQNEHTFCACAKQWTPCWPERQITVNTVGLTETPTGGLS